MIRTPTMADVRELAEVHAAALPDDFLPRLGRRYLRRRFFPTLLMSSGVDLFVAEQSDRVVAFAVFVADGDAVSSALAADKFRLSAYVGAAVLRHPSMARAIVGHLRGFDREIGHDIAGVPELYVMAVSPAWQSDGLGGVLLEHGLDELRTRNLGCLVKTSSPAARRFYERHGFGLIGGEHRPGRTLDVLHRPA